MCSKVAYLHANWGFRASFCGNGFNSAGASCFRDGFRDETVKNLQELHRGGTKLSSVEGKGLETNRSAQNLRIAMGEPRPLFRSPVQPLRSRISAWISLHSRSGRRGGNVFSHKRLLLSEDQREIKSPEIYKCHGSLCPAGRSLGLESCIHRHGRSLSHTCVQERTPGVGGNIFDSSSESL